MAQTTTWHAQTRLASIGPKVPDSYRIPISLLWIFPGTARLADPTSLHRIVQRPGAWDKLPRHPQLLVKASTALRTLHADGPVSRPG